MSRWRVQIPTVWLASNNNKRIPTYKQRYSFTSKTKTNKQIKTKCNNNKEPKACSNFMGEGEGKLPPPPPPWYASGIKVM